MKSFLATLFFVIFASTAQAEDLNISAVILARPCTVDTGTANKVVDLGKYKMREMQSAGAGGDWADLDLLLTNCPAGTSAATVTFSGTADNDDATAFKNTGDAAGVALRLTARDRTTILSDGSTLKEDLDVTSKNITFPLSARFISPKGNPTAGQFAAAVNVSFTYQ